MKIISRNYQCKSHVCFQAKYGNAVFHAGVSRKDGPGWYRAHALRERTCGTTSECIMVNHIFVEETRSLSCATLDFLPSSVHCPVDYAEYTYPGSICFSRVSPSKA